MKLAIDCLSDPCLFVRRRGYGWMTVDMGLTTKASWRSRKSLTTSVKACSRSAVIAWPAP